MWWIVIPVYQHRHSSISLQTPIKHKIDRVQYRFFVGREPSVPLQQQPQPPTDAIAINDNEERAKGERLKGPRVVAPPPSVFDEPEHRRHRWLMEQVGWCVD